MGLIVREGCEEDRAAVAETLGACGMFSAEEVRTALEVFDEARAGGLEAGYGLYAAELEGRLKGYVCGGSTPLTASTWHIYWLCVHPEARGAGVGMALAVRFEELVRSRGGQRLVIETSGRPDYEPARRFYERAGYCPVGRIPDYYKAGDDCVLYCKVL